MYHQYFFLAATITFLACQPKSPNSSHGDDLSVEVITRTYSVNIIDGEPVKDTMNMMQSFILDKSGKERENLYYDLSEQVAWRDIYKLNANGFKIGSQFIDGDTLHTINYTYTIDSLGNRLSYEARDVRTDTLLYDGASQYTTNYLTRIDGYMDGDNRFIKQFIYFFDDKMKETKHIYYSRSGKQYPTYYTYEAFFDDGMWQQRTLRNEDEITAIEIRERRSL